MPSPLAENVSPADAISAFYRVHQQSTQDGVLNAAQLAKYEPTISPALDRLLQDWGGSATPIAHGQLLISTGGTHYLLPGGALVANSANPDATGTTAIERSGVVPGGTTQYVKVPYCVAQGDGTQYFAVRGWHFAVEVAPLQ